MIFLILYNESKMGRSKRRYKKLKEFWAKLSLFFQPVWRRLVLIILLSFTARLLVYGFIKIPWIIFDEFIYLDTARQITRGHFLTQLSRDPQLYPPGWPIIIAAFSGFIKNPFLQYKITLLGTMLISSLVPVLAYWLTSSLWAALLVGFYPPLFVYSSSIMSESFFIFMLMTLVTALKFIVRDDLKKRRSLILAAMVLGVFILFTRLVRSFGVILLPAFILSFIVVAYLKYQKRSLAKLKTFIFFAVITVFSYSLCSYLNRLFFVPEAGFYEKSAYMGAIVNALKRPLFSLRLLQNELTLSVIWLFFILPYFFYLEFKKELHKKEWHMVLPRLFAVFIYLFSLVLTFAHMFIGATHNSEYLVFSRYLDPALTILFVFSVSDFIKYLGSSSVKIKLSIPVIALLAYFLNYFVFSFPKVSYKFGNTMSVYFFLDLNSSFWLFAITALLAIILFALIKNQRRLLLTASLIFFSVFSFLAISKTPAVPSWVGSKYSRVIAEWQMALSNYQTTDIPLCIHRDGVTSETYYLYHFLFPYQYLNSCKTYEQKPRRILTRKKYSFSLQESCTIDYRFSSLESIIYCPLGY